MGWNKQSFTATVRYGEGKNRKTEKRKCGHSHQSNYWNHFKLKSYARKQYQQDTNVHNVKNGNMSVATTVPILGKGMSILFNLQHGSSKIYMP